MTLPNLTMDKKYGVQDELLVWVDIETTGKDPEFGDIPLELGIAVTDLDGNPIDTFQSLLMNNSWGTKLVNADQIVQDMHTDSGLWQELVDNATNDALIRTCQFDVVDQRAQAWLEGLGVQPGVHPLVGSTINFDRSFMKQYFPGLHDHFFHYRNIDISTVRGLCQRLNPEVFDQFEGTKGNHRVLADIGASIELYQFLKKEFLLTTR